MTATGFRRGFSRNRGAPSPTNIAPARKRPPPSAARSRERKNGDESAVATTVAHGSWTNPGSVSASDRIKVRVPVDLKGECPGQRAGGVLSLVLHEIDLECTADAVPERIHANVAHLQLGGTVKVHDLELPAGAKAIADGDTTVVSCTVPHEKAEEAGAMAGVEPEVIGRKAAEEGEAEAEKG